MSVINLNSVLAVLKGGVSVNSIIRGGVEIWRAPGGVLPVSVAPVIASAAAWPEPGSALAISAGTSETAVTLDGALVATVAAGAILNFTATAAGAMVATSADGSASMTVYPALGAVTQITIDAAASFSGTETAVTGVTGNGIIGAAWAATGTGAEVQKVAGGYQFAAGKYLQATTATGLPATNYTGAAIVLKARATAIPASSAAVFQLDNTAGSRIVVQMTTAGSWLASTNAANTVYLIPSDVAVGGDVLIGLEWDYNGGASRVRLIGMDGYVNDWISASSSVMMVLNQARLGQGFTGTIEVAAATLRPDGGAYPIAPLDLWQRVANLRIEDRAALDAGPIFNFNANAQSLGLGFQEPEPGRTHHNLLDRAGVKIPAGLVTTAGAPVNNSMGPTNNDLNQTVPATGLMPAAVSTFGPVSYYMGVALRRRLLAAGMTAPQIMATFTGISGQSMDEFDDDTPVVTGSLGVRIKVNTEYMLAQQWAVSAGRERHMIGFEWMQGEADANDAPDTYEGPLEEVLTQRMDAAEAASGQRPAVAVSQIGTYMNQPNHNYANRRQMLQAAMDVGGLISFPWYQFPVVDGVIHPGNTETQLAGDTSAWMWFEVIRELYARGFVNIQQARVAGQLQAVINAAWPHMIPTTTREGADLVLTFPRPMMLVSADKYAPYGGVVDAGFHDAGTISAVTASGRTIRLTTAATSWRYAEQNYDTSGMLSGGKGFGPSRGLAAEAVTVPSVLIPGATLHRFAPAWSGAV